MLISKLHSNRRRCTSRKCVSCFQAAYSIKSPIDVLQPLLQCNSLAPTKTKEQSLKPLLACAPPHCCTQNKEF